MSGWRQAIHKSTRQRFYVRPLRPTSCRIVEGSPREIEEMGEERARGEACATQASGPRADRITVHVKQRDFVERTAEQLGCVAAGGVHQVGLPFEARPEVVLQQSLPGGGTNWS